MENAEKKHTFARDIAEILIKLKALSPLEAENYKKYFAESDSEQFEEFLLDEELIEKKPLLQALSLYYKVPAIDVTGEFFDHLLLTNLPKDFLLRNEIIPFQIDNDELVIIAADPNLHGLAAAIERFSNNDTVFMVGIGRDICDAVEEFYDKAPTEINEDEDLRVEKQLDREVEDYEEREDDIFRSED